MERERYPAPCKNHLSYLTLSRVQVINSMKEMDGNHADCNRSVSKLLFHPIQHLPGRYFSWHGPYLFNRLRQLKRDITHCNRFHFTVVPHG